MLPLLAAAGLAALKGAAGVGMGFGASRIGENDDYGWRDASVDFGLGAASIPGGSKLLKGGNYFLRGNKYSSKLLPSGGKLMMAKAGGIGLIPFTAGNLGSIGGTPVQGPVITPTKPKGAWHGPMLVDTSSTGGFDLPTISAVPVRFRAANAPTFNKTLADYLGDKDLNRLVGQQIVQMNTPLVAANKSENVKRNRKVNTNKQLGSSLQASYAKALASQAAAHAADIERNTNRSNLLKQQTEDAEAQVPITYLEGEASKAKAEAGSAIANEQSMSDQLVNRLASQGQQYLEQLKNAEASQTRATEQGINNAADDAIRANVAQVRANQAQRGSLLGTLASEQYKNAIDLYNTGVQNFNAAEDRRFQQAIKNAEHIQNANTASAELGLDTVKTLSKGSEKGNEAAVKRGSARLLELQKKLDTARTKMVKDPLGKAGEVPYSSTKAGKKQINDLRQRIAVIKERYQTGPL